MLRLSDDQRNELKQHLYDNMLSCMFGDGLERDYIEDGFPVFKGINNMTDEELVEEYSTYVDEDDEYLKELRAELEIEKILT
jgi:hypothetical protein